MVDDSSDTVVTQSSVRNPFALEAILLIASPSIETVEEPQPQNVVVP
jgi:hypothetical protein